VRKGDCRRTSFGPEGGKYGCDVPAGKKARRQVGRGMQGAYIAALMVFERGRDRRSDNSAAPTVVSTMARMVRVDGLIR
jgi:hypothetical protein